MNDAPVTEPALVSTLRPVDLIGRATAVMVALLGVASFALSFEALRDLAVRTGALPPKSAWIFPILVDGAAIIFSLSAFRASAVGAESDRRWHFSLVVAISLCSVCFNIAHAEKGLVPSAIAAAPPILLFLAFESLLRQLGPERPAAPAKRKPQRKVLPLAGKALPVAANPEAGAKRAKALELAGKGLSQAAVARELGVSAATVSRWLGKGSKAA
ncbi:DUF2637 domain-containing protein [Luteolibacter sp. GHJ8]|uniref:DUF2637 domain-containing protein n=1 Tax=Luteolibacter rhizosphaerae TaxID=2989719 RepID=A0ABT3G0F6_9BACT|nr:DUF2637 domain-containing protein [Luteolibacter rhizosphaerae]MCW1913074.1 DUF2637 domain-containing protein [Luteolibacter rhizosphaerae]